MGAAEQTTNQFYNAVVVSISFTAFTTRNLNYANYAMKIIMRSLTFCSLKNFAPRDVIEQNKTRQRLVYMVNRSSDGGKIPTATFHY